MLDCNGRRTLELSARTLGNSIIRQRDQPQLHPDHGISLEYIILLLAYIIRHLLLVTVDPQRSHELCKLAAVANASGRQLQPRAVPQTAASCRSRSEQYPLQSPQRFCPLYCCNQSTFFEHSSPLVAVKR
jgi:hypothetical protein